jgi:hypothetical protein
VPIVSHLPSSFVFDINEYVRYCVLTVIISFVPILNVRFHEDVSNIYTERLRAFFLRRPQRAGMACPPPPPLLVKNLSKFTVKAVTLC